ncbi:hypothetical protein [Paenarthrobacter sp. PH39-S1]|uniref:hypothetical protein n=1 Tax=Paenarthrobacter sp. PH39-S1 TaxID=3046204 RepID=UPI0024B8B989|nr:hypothetical protein [Paenarthrobacter sp. PH39-S1]MDJ0358326.1 hypothetical protein [Paenarthrobacter sp. PH39-S1]
MNTHGRHAMETMQNHDPEAFNQIQHPEEYFSTLGDQIQEQIWNRTEELLPQRTLDQPPMEFIGLSNMARLRAREMVYQEMIYSSLPPEPEEMEDFTPLTDGTDSELDRENSQQ